MSDRLESSLLPSTICTTSFRLSRRKVSEGPASLLRHPSRKTLPNVRLLLLRKSNPNSRPILLLSSSRYLPSFRRSFRLHKSVTFRDIQFRLKLSGISARRLQRVSNLSLNLDSPNPTNSLDSSRPERAATLSPNSPNRISRRSILHLPLKLFITEGNRTSPQLIRYYKIMLLVHQIERSAGECVEAVTHFHSILELIIILAALQPSKTFRIILLNCTMLDHLRFL